MLQALPKLSRLAAHRVRGDAGYLGEVADPVHLVEHPSPGMRLARGALVRRGGKRVLRKAFDTTIKAIEARNEKGADGAP